MPSKRGDSVKHKKTYTRWLSMLYRVKGKTSLDKKNYLDRGVKVCKRWHAFRNFLEDMGEVSGGMSLDRIDNDGDYEPTNCRWATMEQQMNNTRMNRFLTFKGKTQTISQWSQELGIKVLTLFKRIERGWTTERALSKRSAKRKKGADGRFIQANN